MFPPPTSFCRAAAVHQSLKAGLTAGNFTSFIDDRSSRRKLKFSPAR
jgi:hypothetical protein